MSNPERLAYLFLHLLPLNSPARQAPEIQTAMAFLRDYLAYHDAIGGAERVQNGFEEVAQFLNSYSGFARSPE